MAGNSDKDKLHAGFLEVFKYLSSPDCCIADDAILHILADVLAQKLTEEDEQFILQSGIADFLDNACLISEGTDTSIVVLALKICSLLCATKEKYKKWESTIKNCHGKIWKARKTAGASVITALYECLRAAAQHSLGVKWIISEYNGCIGEAFEHIEAGSSVFLEKSICDFLSDLVLSTVSIDGKLDTHDLKDIHQQIVDRTCLSIHQLCLDSEADISVQKTRSILRNMLRLTESICNSAGSVVDTMLQSEEFVTDIQKVVSLTSGPEYEICLKIVSAILQKGVQLNVIELAECLWQRGDVTKSLKLVTKVYTSEQGALPLVTCHAILTSPLLFVLGKEGTTWIESLRTSQFTKTHIKNILSTTLSCLSQCKMNDVCTVLKVLKATVRTANVSPGRSTFSVHLENSRKLQCSCLQYCLDVKDMFGENDLEQLMDSVIQIIAELNMDTVTYNLCMKCLHSNLPWLTKSTPQRPISTDLANLLQRHLCSLQWELRDTTVEFIGNVAKEYSGDASVTQWLQTHGLHLQMWQCVQDGESYVRASAITALGHLHSSSTLWQSLLQCVDITEEALLEQVITVLESDTEAFARRSAAEFLVGLYKSPTVTIPLMSPLVRALTDFDWEVKLCALCFVDSVVQEHLDKCVILHSNTPDYAKGLLPSNNRDSNISSNIQFLYRLYTVGCLTGVLKCLDDYDEKVCVKAVESMGLCQNKLKLIFTDNLCDQEKLKALCEEALSEHNVDSTHTDTHTEGNEPCSKRFKSDSSMSDKSIDSNNKKDKFIQNTVKEFTDTIQAIVDFDASLYQSRFESQSDYYTNPHSLIQDILSYCTKGEEENLVDCY